MTKEVITVPPDFTVEETALVLQKNKISGAPVVDSRGKLVGTITQTDLFRVLISLTGVAKGGIQFGLQIEDRPGSIKEVADVLRHRSLDTSLIYAKLDLQLLAEVALPWPGSAS